MSNEKNFKTYLFVNKVWKKHESLFPQDIYLLLYQDIFRSCCSQDQQCISNRFWRRIFRHFPNTELVHREFFFLKFVQREQQKLRDRRNMSFVVGAEPILMEGNQIFTSFKKSHIYCIFHLTSVNFLFCGGGGGGAMTMLLAIYDIWSQRAIHLITTRNTQHATRWLWFWLRYPNRLINAS